MLLKISVISIAVFVLSIALYIFKTSKKSRRPIRKVSGFVSLISLITAVVCFIIYVRSNNIDIFNRLKSYDINEKYTSKLAKKGADAAYPILPVKAFSQSGEFYIVNSNDDAFVIGEENGEYTLKTYMNKVSYLGSSRTLKATVNSESELILDGYLLYSQYDGKLIEYNNKVVAKNVEFCNFTANSLFYITKDGNLYGLGFNEYGQLGDTTTKNKSKPELIKNDVAKASVSDSHALIVDKYGTLFAVGDNSYSQLGNKTAISSTEPIKIMQGVKDVRAGNYYSLVLTVNGELYTAGINDKGQLGNGGEEYKAVLIQALSGVEKIEISGNTCAALTYSGELYVWGDNKNFKAGYTEEKDILSPVKLYDNIYDFALGENGVVIITNDRDVLVSDEEGKIKVCSVFGAQIPENFKDKFSSKYNISDKKV